ncbi:NnrS family protein [Xanthobacter sp. DSM 24535]|uniref:NnrS family protein n=1 Tax=Roseixanthobacter psychrophilus TaxID=3119917 RepID=UPI00372C52FF
MKRTAQARRAYEGAALWSRGFRPFFLAGGLWAVAAIAIWPPFFTGEVTIPTAFSPQDWHVHEMVYGFGAVVVAGFLLTAVPNWTGRLPVAGRPLIALAAVWLAGRIAVFLSAQIGWIPALAIDVSFLLVLGLVIGREVVAGRNWRNLKVASLVLLLGLANAMFHVEAALEGTAAVSARAGVALMITLILLVGGRVVPSFTHNWLAKQGIAERPVPFGTADGLVLALSGAALAAWVALPHDLASGAALLLAGGANLWRLSRWQGWRTGGDGLVLVLHVGFLFAAVGFLAAGAHTFAPDIFPVAFGIHIWAIGAIGTMTLAIMTRATLGHTGQALRASRATLASYLLISVAVGLRLAMIFASDLSIILMYLSGFSWVAAFAIFVAVYGRSLVGK